jgi:hypothetical protein
MVVPLLQCWNAYLARHPYLRPTTCISLLHECMGAHTLRNSSVVTCQAGSLHVCHMHETIQVHVCQFAIFSQQHWG